MKNFTHSIVKNRSSNIVVAKFVNPAHAKSYCEILNRTAGKKQYHWHETTGSM